MGQTEDVASSQEKLTLFASPTNKQPYFAGLVSRIATKTFDAIHRSHVFRAQWEGQDVILKAWEVSETEAGLEMLEM